MNGIGTLLFFTLFALSCSGQSKTDSFNTFLANFENAKLPLNVVKFMVNKAAKNNNKQILRADFDKYLREEGNTFWKFEEYFEYEYGGKLKLDDKWVVFYSRHYIPDNVFVQKGEFVLAVFNLSGTLISAIPVAGGYGDSLTFNSEINNLKEIRINFTSYETDKESTFAKSYYLNENGVFIKISENK